MRARPGFTMIELLVVMAILGLLVTIGFPMFHEGQVGARRGVCIDRQHLVFEGALIYCAENIVPDGTMNVSTLTPGLIQTGGGECPMHTDGSGNDYSITISNRAPVDVTCDIHGDSHPWAP